jgi:hypothetical protein
MKPIMARIKAEYPSLRVEMKPDPNSEARGYRIDRLEIWTPFMHVEMVSSNPTTYQICHRQQSVQIAWFEDKNDGFYLCSNSPLCYCEKVSADNVLSLLLRLLYGSNWSVPW